MTQEELLAELGKTKKLVELLKEHMKRKEKGALGRSACQYGDIDRRVLASFC
ncbi:hypothetical protein NYV35_25700 [Escherichia coli]|nr:hypothetical protein [Escherichia coli]